MTLGPKQKELESTPMSSPTEISTSPSRAPELRHLLEAGCDGSDLTMCLMGSLGRARGPHQEGMVTSPLPQPPHFSEEI